MKRIVLALLALFGIVAQTATVDARVCGAGSAQIGTVLAPRTQGQALAAKAQPGISPQDKGNRRGAECPPAPTRKRPVYIPSVQLGGDRALE